MEHTVPRFIPGENVVFRFDDKKESMGVITGAIRTDVDWRYYVSNPGNAQIPYVVEGNRIVSVYRDEKWVSTDT